LADDVTSDAGGFSDDEVVAAQDPPSIVVLDDGRSVLVDVSANKQLLLPGKHGWQVMSDGNTPPRFVLKCLDGPHGTRYVDKAFALSKKTTVIGEEIPAEIVHAPPPPKLQLKVAATPKMLPPAPKKPAAPTKTVAVKAATPGVKGAAVVTGKVSALPKPATPPAKSGSAASSGRESPAPPPPPPPEEEVPADVLPEEEVPAHVPPEEEVPAVPEEEPELAPVAEDMMDEEQAAEDGLEAEEIAEHPAEEEVQQDAAGDVIDEDGL